MKIAILCGPLLILSCTAAVTGSPGGGADSGVAAVVMDFPFYGYDLQADKRPCAVAYYARVPDMINGI